MLTEDQMNNGSSSEISQSTNAVYVDPGVYTSNAGSVQCQPPCTFIMPPYVLPDHETTTISFEPYTTTLTVVWMVTSTITIGGAVVPTTASSSVIQTTVLDIPPISTTAIPVSDVTFTTDGGITDLAIVPSVQPAPFVITDDPNPLGEADVSHSQSTRTVTLSAYSATSSSTAKDSDTGPLFPIVPVIPIIPIIPAIPVVIGVGTPSPICLDASCGSGDSLDQNSHLTSSATLSALPTSELTSSSLTLDFTSSQAISSSSSSTATSSSSTSSCTTCTSCAGFDTLGPEITETPSDEDFPEYPWIDPSIWSSSSSIEPTSAQPTSAQSLPTQPANPIDEPTCSDMRAEIGTLPLRSIRMPDGNDVDLNELMYRVRQVLCDGTCTAPSGIPDTFVASYSSDGECEVSVGLTNQTELYFYRGTAPDSDQWQQCWDSTESIIKSCIDNNANEGWWNGNHVYQFYHARSIQQAPNDPPTSSSTIGYGLRLKVLLVHRTAMVIYLMNSCAPHLKRGNPQVEASRGVLERAPATVNLGGCRIRSYKYPGYSSSGSLQMPGGNLWYDRDDSVDCLNPALSLFSPKINRHQYDTEHVYEKHFVTRFLYYLVSNQTSVVINDDDIDDVTAIGVEFEGDMTTIGSPLTDCATLQQVFGSTTTDDFADQSVAQQLANAVSCYHTSTCEDNSRLDEFFLLEHNINGAKNRVLAGYYTGVGADKYNDQKLPSCTSGDYTTAQQQMILYSLVFKYMREDAVFRSFDKANSRMRVIMDKLDNHPLGQANRPAMEHITSGPNTWLKAYDEFMVNMLETSEKKMRNWMDDCFKFYMEDMKSKVIDENRQMELEKSIRDRSTGYDSYSLDSMSFGPRYARLRGDL
ncbi:hypothetical protein E4T43_03190 [Aureobasidium subglaciale]|nr:hypothetical protein E4T43_03190 [Aureobasidium subglaciale]